MRTTEHTLHVAGRLGVMITVLCLLAPVTLLAKEMSVSEVQAAVETWVHHMTKDARPDAVITRLEEYEVDGVCVAYIAHISEGGFCLCAADDILLPVYFYCPEGQYDGNNPDLCYILNRIATRRNLVTEYPGETAGLGPDDYAQAVSERTQLWQALISGALPARSAPEGGDRTEPELMLLDFTPCWHQYSPYNSQCPAPIGQPDMHTIVGCVATAEAQIMHYWKWPQSGTGENTVIFNYRWRAGWDGWPCPPDPMLPLQWPCEDRLQWTQQNGGTLFMTGYWDGSVLNMAKTHPEIQNPCPEYLAALDSLYARLTPEYVVDWVDFSAAEYNWDLIQDEHHDPPDPTDDEVAKLCHHVGVAADMGYGIMGSGPPVPTPIEQVFPEHFRYDQDVTWEGPPDIYVMTDEITWLRPLGLVGNTLLGGHMWVASGYDKSTDPDRSFWMNLGWGPGCIGWYVLDYWFPIDQSTVHMIAPFDVVRFVATSGYGDGSPAQPHGSIEEAIIEAPNGATLIFEAGTENTFWATTLIIDRPLTLKGYDVTIRRQ